MNYIKAMAIIFGFSALLLGFIPSHLELVNIKTADFSALLIFGGAFIGFLGSASFINRLLEGFFPNFRKKKLPLFKYKRSNTMNKISRIMLISGAVTLGLSLMGLVFLGLIIKNDTASTNEHIEIMVSQLLYVVLMASVVLIFLGRWFDVLVNFRERF